VTTVRIHAADLAGALGQACRAHGIDLAGAVALDGPAPRAAAWQAWLDRGLHGDLDYLVRTRDERADPRRHNPGATSLLVFAQRYTDGWPGGDEELPDWLRGVSRYARGDDYHDILKRSVRAVVLALGERWPDLLAFPSVDTGPYLERAWAERAGLGFVGRNACLIHETLGSGLFLAVAPTNLVIDGLDAATSPLWDVSRRRPAPRPDTDRCGTCTRCLDACPTGAIVEPRVVDADRCLSTWTIERQGRAPADRRVEQGGHLFGCDVCQQVCPWNGKALRTAAARSAPPQGYAPRPDHADLQLADLLVMDADTFRARFRRTPLWRAHPAGLRRNALVVAANTGRTDLLDVVRRVARDDPDADVRDVAAWAVSVLEERS
jgi:epoxyqueuosine reductase